MKQILLFLLLVVLLNSCGGSLTFPLAAVTNTNKGEIVNVTMTSFYSENSKTLISLPPYYGLDLQYSIVSSIKQGNTKNCSFIVEFQSSSHLMEGSSAGAAFSVMSYFLSNNISPKNMAVITGGVEPDGTLFPVGGVYEKALAASNSGVRNFIFPYGSIYDYVMAKKVEETRGIKAIPAKNIYEIIDFVAYGKEPQNITFKYKPIGKNITTYQGKKYKDFLDIAKKMIEREKESIKDLNKSAETWITEYFSYLGEDCDYILAKDYYYTAANKAFLAYTDTNSLIFLYNGKPTYEDRKKSVESCLTSLKRPKLTENNFEWVIAFDLRKAWAENMLEKVNNNSTLLEEKVSLYRDLVFSEGWCLAAADLQKKAEEDENGMAIDESSLKTLADNYLKIARNMTHSGETQERFEIAKKLYEEKKYGAAIFDFIFVISMDESKKNMSDVENLSKYLTKKELEFMWPNIYKSQAEFMMAGENPDYQNAFSLLIFSQSLDDALKKINQTVKANTKESNEKKEKNNNFYDYFFVCAIAIIFILLIILLIYVLQDKKRRSSERENNTNDRIARRKRKLSS